MSRVRSMILETPRVRLRQWLLEDAVPCAALGQDPDVMRHFPALLSRAQSDALIARASTLIDDVGWGLWALEIVDADAARRGFAGFVGLAGVGFDADFTPAVEVGWRLAPWAWGAGYATEAAGLALDYAFDVVGLTDVVSFTTVENRPSQAVMKRLGMRHDGGFLNPRLPEGHSQRPHVLYRLTAEQWSERSMFQEP